MSLDIQPNLAEVGDLHMKRSTVRKQIARIEKLLENDELSDSRREDLESQLESLDQQFDEMDEDPETLEQEKFQDNYDRWRNEY